MKKIYALVLVLVCHTLVQTIDPTSWDHVMDESDKSEWIDPNDMGFSVEADPKPTMPKDIAAKSTIAKDKPIIPAQGTNFSDSVKNTDRPFLVRHVKRLLVAFGQVQMIDTEYFDAILSVHLSASDVTSLQAYASLESTSSTAQRLHCLHAIDNVLEKLIHKITLPNERSMSDDVRYYLATLFHQLDILIIVLPICVTSFLVISLWRGMPVWKAVVLLFLISCAWEWSHLYKKVIARRHEVFKRQETAPNHCNTDSLSFLERLFYNAVNYRPNDQCIKYQEALMVDAYLEVTPAMAIAETVSKIILHPIDQLGEKLGMFFSRVLAENSYMASIGVTILSFAFLALILIMSCGYSIRFPFFLGAIEPQREQSANVQKLVLEIQTMRQALEAINASKPVQAITTPSEESSTVTCNAPVVGTTPTATLIIQGIEEIPTEPDDDVMNS
jgi:hypothetical protein